jgi:predicted nucleic acid-binding protein
VPDGRHLRGLIDTSVVIDLDAIEPDNLPIEVAVSAVTMAELAAGPHATTDPAERARTVACTPR